MLLYRKRRRILNGLSVHRSWRRHNARRDPDDNRISRYSANLL